MSRKAEASKKCHIRHCILFAFQLKKNASEATEMICSALGESAITYKTCKKWYQRFRSGDFDLSDRERSGQPRKFEDEELEQLLCENSAQTQHELAMQLGVSQKAISHRLNKERLIKKRNQLILHKLSPENRERRYETAISLLTRFKQKDFLHKIITYDEKWVLYHNPKRIKSSVHSEEPSTFTVKSNIHTKKVLLCIWWDVKGVVYYELLQPCQTDIADRYQQQLIRVSDELERKRPFTGNGTRHVILQQNNTRPQITKAAKDIICSLGWEILPHAAYSPDLAPSNFYLFRSLKHHLTDTNFQTLEEVQKSIDEFIASKSPPFFLEGIRQLPERWTKVIENNGDYFKE